MGVDRAYADPIASDAARLMAAAYANVDRPITASSVTLLSEKQREWFEDIVARAGQ
jgi:hypothetical protein